MHTTKSIFYLIFCLIGLISCKAPTCFDGKLNGNEIGVDCGGYCDACPSGEDVIAANKIVPPTSLLGEWHLHKIYTEYESGSVSLDLLRNIVLINFSSEQAETDEPKEYLIQGEIARSSSYHQHDYSVWDNGEIKIDGTSYRYSMQQTDTLKILEKTGNSTFKTYLYTREYTPYDEILRNYGLNLTITSPTDLADSLLSLKYSMLNSLTAITSGTTSSIWLQAPIYYSDYYGMSIKGNELKTTLLSAPIEVHYRYTIVNRDEFLLYASPPLIGYINNPLAQHQRYPDMSMVGMTIFW